MCFSCLNLGRGTRNCQRRKPCAIEGYRRVHHKLLHEAIGSKNNFPSQSTPSQPCIKSTSANAQNSNRPTPTQRSSHTQQVSQEPGPAVLSCSSADSKLLYRILPVTLYGNQRRIDTYALLDEGSSITMIDSDIVRELGIQGRKQSLNIQWFGGRTVEELTMVVDLLISGAGMEHKHNFRSVFAVSNLQLPLQSVSKDDLKSNVQRCHLPVRPYNEVRPKLLTGLDHCHLGLPSTTIKLNMSGPFVAKTQLGWVVFGPTTASSTLPSTCLYVNSQADQLLHNLVSDFFDTESFGVSATPPIVSDLDVRATAILKTTTCRVDGRFQTGLLWKSDNIKLPNSYNMALKRLANVEKKMSCDTNFATEYKHIMDSYISNKYARKLSAAEAAMSTPTTWYLPHFAVANPNKPGKLRMVFDAAAEVSGISLNSQLLKGPQAYRLLTSILFHIREGAVAVCADIREMSHQVLIQEQDRCAQRFLWRSGDPTSTPDVYEMCVTTFGAACSPCAANYVKTINALEHQSENCITKRAVKAILDHHYVDDFVDSFGSEEEAISVSEEVRAIHKKAGFELRHFTSNSSKVVAALGGSDDTRVIAKKEGVLAERVLGMFWESFSDCFGFKLKFHNVDPAVINGIRRPSKRELLSVVMSICDPLGLLSNFVVGAVMEYAIPRFYFRNGAPHKLQLHVFVDASEDAFAAVAYWRSCNSFGDVEVAFVCAKSKCAPMKTLTIPRLELQAAVLGTRLMQCIREEHLVDIEDCILWSDSTTVIKWLRSEHRRYKPFVQHRVAEILATTNIRNWRWIPSALNVADETTRKNDNVDFSKVARWSCGPQFLQKEELTWPCEDVIDRGKFCLSHRKLQPYKY
ncbi:uncharacterized protein [Eurosta solidaginis]|uniref:uncharacterized protein n=1 Tax=Eurosta solidaginis TaxID=178769 RepID=UPI0035316DF2